MGIDTMNPANRKAASIALASAAIMVALSGCVDVSGPSNGNPTEAPRSTARISLSAPNMLYLQDAAPGDNVRIQQSKEAVQTYLCQKEGPRDYWYYWLNIWNRTGLAVYHHATVDRPQAQPLDITATLPPDPPFLIWVGLECGSHAKVEFSAHNWTVSSPQIRSEPPEDRVWLVQDRMAWTNITIAPGQTEAIKPFFVQGMDFHIVEGLRLGMVEMTQGQRYGDLFVYEPHQHPPDGQWILQTEYRPWGISSSERHTILGMNGEYLIQTVLSAPSVEQTQWSAEASVWSFRPVVRELGFEAPFAVYDIDPDL